MGRDEGDSPQGTPGGTVARKGSLEWLWTLREERPHRHNSLGSRTPDIKWFLF